MQTALNGTKLASAFVVLLAALLFGYVHFYCQGLTGLVYEDTLPLTAGAYVVHPKGAVHFDGVCGEEPVEVQIIGLGPVATTWVEETP